MHKLGVVETAEEVARGGVSAVEVAKAAIARIAARDRELGAFLYVDAEGALAEAAEVDRRRARGESLGALAGVPVALKDVLCTRGIPTTSGSRVLEGWIPPYDATVVTRLRAAGAVLVGKTNMDEMAMGSSTENSAYGVARNPWSLDRTPGGSSGGSAAATAAAFVPAALGTDTGGSIRQPASLCGIVGVKPTYGRVSRWGLVAFASSLDQAGPFARSVRDAARILGVIAGHDRRDATSVQRGVPSYEAACGRDPRGVRVGYVRETAAEKGLDPSVRHAVAEAVEKLASLGAEVREVSLPHAHHGLAVYYLVAPAEASSNLARFDGMRYGPRVTGNDLASTYAKTRARGFGKEVRRRIMLGTYALSAGYYEAFYLKAQKVRTLIRQDFERAFGEVDVIVGPTSPTPAFRLGEKVSDPLSMYLADVFTLPASLAGVPAISVPCGSSDEGLPIGLQLVAPAFEEERLFTLAHAYEQATRWKDRHPHAYW
ncbi:MAG: Asp-tRNA(Asn)/Glu-tRNA(Gln) amidotransferase subunit GatA [Deltaproteobacteria bacterium]|nr:Asp-tRNA(Asn)/Glu-tRNA(Gln) amidotransferase subunit GatA [Deltaproteobacteria bacterium]